MRSVPSYPPGANALLTEEVTVYALSTSDCMYTQYMYMTMNSRYPNSCRYAFPHPGAYTRPLFSST